MRDPLCSALVHGITLPGCFCAELRTARLQGPVKVTGHAPVCWCEKCMA